MSGKSKIFLSLLSRVRPVLFTSSEQANRDYERISELAPDGRIFLISPSRQMDISRLEGDMKNSAPSITWDMKTARLPYLH